MKTTIESELELQREAVGVLMKHLPPSKVARLLSLWHVGSGDYTLERRQLFPRGTVNSLFKQAKTIEKLDAVKKRP